MSVSYIESGIAVPGELDGDKVIATPPDWLEDRFDINQISYEIEDGPTQVLGRKYEEDSEGYLIFL